jgi:threonine/homoserine/homoserine lactone efflux protein
VHTFAAAAGLSAVLATSATVFSAVKYAGAAYLVYLGVRALLARGADGPAPTAAQDEAPLTRVFRRAVVTNVLNPKVALFFLAFVPQFVSAARGHVSLQFVLLGLTFSTTGTIVNVIVGLLSGRIARVLREKRAYKRALDKATGAVFVALGVRLALAEPR